MGTAERKILIVFVYYVFLSSLALFTFSQVTRDDVAFAVALQRYFECESKGVDPDNPCDKSGYESFIVNTALSSISFISLGLYPLVNLVFVIDVQEFKQWLKKRFPRLTKTSQKNFILSGK